MMKRDIGMGIGLRSVSASSECSWQEEVLDEEDEVHAHQEACEEGVSKGRGSDGHAPVGLHGCRGFSCRENEERIEHQI